MDEILATVAAVVVVTQEMYLIHSNMQKVSNYCFLRSVKEKG
jgi:hypothetical protein